MVDTYSFTGRINNAKEVYSERNTSNVRCAVLGYPETETRKEQEYGHEWERGQQQVASTKGINRVERRQSKQPVDDAEPERCSKGGSLGKVGVNEDLGRVVGNGVDAAELLHEHCDAKLVAYTESRTRDVSSRRIGDSSCLASGYTY